MNLVRMNDDMEFSIRDTKIITFWKNNNKNVKNIHKFSTFSSLFLDQGVVVWTARELGIFLMTYQMTGKTALMASLKCPRCPRRRRMLLLMVKNKTVLTIFF